MMPASTMDAPASFAHDLFRAQARGHPDAHALVDDSGVPLRYADLLDRVDVLAAELHGRGATGRPVAVLLERSADTVVAMLAVLTAGCVYCPLDRTAPAQRMTAILQALGTRVAIADGANAERLPGTVDVIPPVCRRNGQYVPPAGPRHDAVAYVMHTSGSTGAPKGVAMSHRGLSRLVRWQVRTGAHGLRTLQFTPTSFDVTFQEVLSTLATGGCLVVAPEQVRRDPAALLDKIVEQCIQRLFLPYVALQLLAVEAQSRSLVPESLEHVVTAGERLIVTPAIRELFDAIPRCRFDNHYGPTEAHLVTSFTLPADRASWAPIPSIGVPVDGVSCQVLGARLDTMPEGDVGELYVGGDGLAEGYLHDPVQTAERFVADPYGGRSGSRLYRTGDLVRMSADGTYDFVGRNDGQLKVRGFRVEPAEVVNALTSHPRVDAAAVGMRDVADGLSVLVAYLQTDETVSYRAVTDHVRGLLPAHMVPARHVCVESMPRTASGKVDLRALAELELPTAPEPAAETSLTDVVVGIWTRVLGHGDFASDDDFFDVGGDSLLATWVVAELSQVLDRPVDLSLFLDASTVADLADALGTDAVAHGAPSPSQIVTLRPGPSARSLYLVHPLGGELIGYRELSRASRAPARFLGICWAGEPPEFGSSLAEIAATHVEQLRTVQPDGPYLLAGWSFGGVLAFEMAQQLQATGGAVEFLGLLDANPVVDPITGLPLAETPFLGLLDDVLAGLDDPAVTEDEIAELTSGDTWLSLMGAPIASGTSSTYLRDALRTARACMWAAMRYEPRPYPGPVDVFQASAAGPERQEQLAAAIRAVCTGECSVTAVPGDHWGFIRGENVTEAATELDAALERAGAAGSATHGS